LNDSALRSEGGILVVGAAVTWFPPMREEGGERHTERERVHACEREGERESESERKRLGEDECDGRRKGA
jgi:hypothetical protein